MRFRTETSAPETLTYISGGIFEETSWLNNISEVAVIPVPIGLDGVHVHNDESFTVFAVFSVQHL